VGPGPDYIAYVFVFLNSTITCRLYKLTFIEQAQVTLQLRFSVSDFVYIFLGGLSFLGGGGNPPRPGPKSALGGSGHTYYISKQAITTKKNAGVQCTHLAQDRVLSRQL